MCRGSVIRNISRFAALIKLKCHKVALVILFKRDHIGLILLSQND